MYFLFLGQDTLLCVSVRGPSQIQLCLFLIVFVPVNATVDWLEMQFHGQKGYSKVGVL